MGIDEKLNQVMKAVTSVNKTGKMGTGSYSYGYHSREDAFIIRPALVAAGVSVLTRVISSQLHVGAVKRKNGAWNLVAVELAVEFRCTETGESRIASGIGHGADAADQGASKAQTNALKNALLNSFMLGEEDHHQAQGVAVPQVHQQSAAPTGDECRQFIKDRMKELGFSKPQYNGMLKFISEKEDAEYGEISEARMLVWHGNLSKDDEDVRVKILKILQSQDKAA